MRELFKSDFISWLGMRRGKLKGVYIGLCLFEEGRVGFFKNDEGVFGGCFMSDWGGGGFGRCERRLERG